MSGFEYAALSDTGQVRERNEDNWFAKPEAGLFGVSDGMGGEFAGALASEIVVRTLPPLLAKAIAGVTDLARHDIRQQVLAAFSTLSRQMRRESTDRAGMAGMGATAVVAIVRRMQALIVHIGDSRAYLLRDGTLDQVTKDHSLVQALFDRHEITPDQATDHPARGKLTRYIGMEGTPLPEAEWCLELQPGNRLLLCTDGLTNMLTDADIAEILKRNPACRNACASLISAANEAGGNDNITALVISILEQAKEQ